VAHNGLLFEKGYDLADKDANIPNTPQTRFRIGSITKQFTAMAILILQDRGKLHLQDPICLYVSDCPQDWQPITIENLLTHTSGIPDYINSPDFVATWTEPATPEELIARFKDMPLEFPPGSRFKYSNSGYALLGYITERVSGESYATFLRENIFVPSYSSFYASCDSRLSRSSSRSREEGLIVTSFISTIENSFSRVQPTADSIAISVSSIFFSSYGNTAASTRARIVMSYIIVFAPFEGFVGRLILQPARPTLPLFSLPDDAASSEPQTYQPYNIWFIASHDKILPRE
jgi:hypothetical protein